MLFMRSDGGLTPVHVYDFSIILKQFFMINIKSLQIFLLNLKDFHFEDIHYKENACRNRFSIIVWYNLLFYYYLCSVLLSPSVLSCFNLYLRPLIFSTICLSLISLASFTGAQAILSGPAGGVVGYALTTYSELDGQPVIGFDMGGK